MSVKDAVANRIQNICLEHGMKTNQLANISGLIASTLYSLLDPQRRDVSIVTSKKLCDGLEMSLEEFFVSPEFRSLEQKIVYAIANAAALCPLINEGGRSKLDQQSPVATAQ